MSHFLQKGQVDAERPCLVEECGVRTGGKSAGSGMTVTGCVLVVPVVTLRLPQVLVLLGEGH